VCLPIEDETLRQRLVLAYPSGGPATLTAQEAMPVIRDCFAARSFQAAQNSAD
jgi:hypothetical protein